MARAKVSFKLDGKWVKAGDNVDIPIDPKKVDSELKMAITNGYLGHDVYVQFSSKKMVGLDVKSEPKNSNKGNKKDNKKGAKKNEK